jgi:hypothetical protein
VVLRTARNILDRIGIFLSPTRDHHRTTWFAPPSTSRLLRDVHGPKTWPRLHAASQALEATSLLICAGFRQTQVNQPLVQSPAWKHVEMGFASGPPSRKSGITNRPGLTTGRLSRKNLAHEGAGSLQLLKRQNGSSDPVLRPICQNDPQIC